MTTAFFSILSVGNTKAVSYRKKTSLKRTLQHLKWPALAERRREHVFQLVKKCIEGRCPQYFDGYFTFNNKIHTRATRQRDLLHLPAVRTEVAKRSFYYYGCVVFNDFSRCLLN